MRYSILISVLFLALISCNKDKFKTEPQVFFKSWQSDSIKNAIPFEFKATIEITDKEGDIGLIPYDSTSYIIYRDAKTLKIDSFKVADITRFNSPKLKFEVTFPVNNVLPQYNRNRRDTVFVEFAVTDFQKNRSAFTKSTPLYYVP